MGGLLVLMMLAGVTGACRPVGPSVMVMQTRVDPAARNNNEAGVQLTFSYSVSFGGGDATKPYSLYAALKLDGEYHGTPVRISALVPAGHSGNNFDSPQPVSVFLPALNGGNTNGMRVVVLLKDESASGERFEEVYSESLSGPTAPLPPAPQATGTRRPLSEQRIRATGLTLNNRPLAQVSAVDNAVELNLVCALALEYHPDDLTPLASGERTDEYEIGIRIRRASDNQLIYPPSTADLDAFQHTYFNNGQAYRLDMRVPLERVPLSGPTDCIVQLVARTETSRHEFPVLASQAIRLSAPSLYNPEDQRIVAVAPRLVADYAATGARSLMVQASVRPRLAPGLIRGVAEDPTAAHLVLEAEVRTPQGRVLYTTATPRNLFPSQPGQLLTVLDTNRTQAVSILLPYSQLGLPPGTHDVEVIVYARNREGTVRLPESIRQRTQITMPRLLECTLAVTEVQAEQIFDYDIGRGLPDTYWRIEVGPQRVFISREATNQFLGLPGTASFRICPGDHVTLGVYDSDVTSFDDVIGVKELGAINGPTTRPATTETFERVKRIEYSFSARWAE